MTARLRSLVVLLALVGAAPAHAATPDPVVPRGGRCAAAPDSTLSALHASGMSFPDFVAAAKARREGWLRLADSAVVSDALATRARALASAGAGAWRLLVVAVDSCGDSMNTVPYAAKVAALAGVSLRIVHPREGRAVRLLHRSLDGRTATPTYVLLDPSGAERGCLVEQPRALREWSSAERSRASLDSVHAGIRAFYAKDQGASMALEVVELLEAALAGRTMCDRGVAK
ncbi:thioredoxin family protein [Gemmatimonas sp.]|uniref:thioredoxin family protein n=1 Tax=Gemmatimonas sp. TaxID=1962908 RepID=UPI00391C7E6E